MEPGQLGGMGVDGMGDHSKGGEEEEGDLDVLEDVREVLEGIDMGGAFTQAGGAELAVVSAAVLHLRAQEDCTALSDSGPCLLHEPS
jgi:hypothetical protein